MNLTLPLNEVVKSSRVAEWPMQVEVPFIDYIRRAIKG